MLGLTPVTKTFAIIWTAIVIIIGIGGNGLVLLRSIKYQALRMDRISIYLLECVAITDISLACFHFMSNLVTVISERWILGESYCFILATYIYIGYGTEIKLMLAIGVYRCCLLMFPFMDIPEFTPTRKILFFAGTIGLETCVTCAVIFVNGYKAVFIPSMLTRDITFAGEYPSIIVALWSFLIPGILLISSNIFLLNKALTMSGEKLNKKNSTKGLTTIMVLGWAYVLSYGPCVTMMGLGFTEHGSPSWLFGLQNLALGLNLFVNPVIYTFTHSRFFGFMKTMTGIEPSNSSSSSFLNRRL